MRQTVTIYQILDYLKTKEDLTEAELELKKWACGVYKFDGSDPFEEEYFIDYAVRRALEQDHNFNNFLRDKILVIRLVPKGEMIW